MLSTTFTLSKPTLHAMLLPALGCASLIMGAYIKVPFYPVPLTLQTFALLVIALTLPPRQACYSACGYLLLATLGFPVFYWHANPYWGIGKCAGYLWAFPISVYWIAKMKSKIGYFFASATGAVLIFTCGALWLLPFVGLKAAWLKGFVCFIPCGLSKILLALSLIKGRQK